MDTKIAAERLHTVLLLDAATCTAMALLLTLGARLLAGFTGIPDALLFYAGAALVPIAGFMIVTARRYLDSPVAVGAVIAGNVAWVLASVALIVGSWIEPNGLGHAFIGAQAAAVAAFALVEYAAFRGTTAAPAVRGTAASRV